MQKTNPILIALLACVTLFSCKKLDVNPEKPLPVAQQNENGISVNDGRKYFQAMSQTGMVARTDGETISFVPQWEKSFSSRNAEHQFIEVPVQNRKKKVVILRERGTPSRPELQIKSAFQTFAIYRDSLNGLQYRLITYVGSEEYLQKRRRDISHNRIGNIDPEFDGYISYANQFGTHLFTLQVRHGVPYRKITAYGPMSSKTNGGRQSATNSPSAGAARWVCHEICIENWVQYCTQVMTTYWDESLGKEVTYEGGEVCEDVLESTECHEVCQEIDDEEEPESCYDTTDPAGDCYDPSNDNGSGGSGGTPSASPSEIAWPGDIKCSSFKFVTIGTSQSAAVKLSNNPSFGTVGTTKYREFPIRTLIIDLPKNITHPEPQYISPGYAAEKCAQALNTTVRSLGATYGNSGAWETITVSTFENNLLQTFQALLQTDIPGARVSFESATTYTTRPGLTPNNSEHDGFFDGIFGGGCQ